MAGLEAAARMLQQHAAGMVAGVKVPVLILVADAPGKPTRAVRARAHELAGAVEVVLHIPWIATWRDNPYTANRAVEQVAAEVTALTQKETP